MAELNVYRITTPDGVFDVEAPDSTTAAKDLKEHRQELANKAAIDKANTAPEWAKPFMALDDIARVAPNEVTGGWLDKGIAALTGQDPDEIKMETQARRNRMGLAAPVSGAVAAAASLPTAVPKVMGLMGGGPLARGIVGTGTAAVEGAGIGGIQAAGSDENLAPAMSVGGALGAAGHQIGGILNKANKWFRGIDDSVPQGIRSKITQLPPGQKNPSAVDKVTVAANEAKQRAATSDNPLATQKNTKENINELLINDPKSFTKEQRSMMGDIVNDDPATKGARMLGNILGNKMIASGVGAGLGSVSGVLPGILTTGGMMAGSRILKGASAGGTEEAMNDLLRKMRGKDKYVGPISLENRNRITKALRQLGLDATPEED